jgi:hypothetical protein
MAKPIKETPVLMGEDAKRFLKQKEENKGKKLPPEEVERIMKSYKKFRVID